jgi:hypothetical protein
MMQKPIGPVTDPTALLARSPGSPPGASAAMPIRPPASPPGSPAPTAMPPPTESDDASPGVSRSLATSLVPVLRRDTELRLGEINWFRADWQRGGAATGHSTWTMDDGREIPVVVKLPVPQRELTWMRRLQPHAGRSAEENFPPVIPLLMAGGSEINGYDIAWVVMERLPYGPLGMKWRNDTITRLAEAVARFHRIASEFPVDRAPRIEDWHAQIRHAATEVERHELPEADRWQRLLSRTERRIDELVARWRERPIGGWIHGDAHPANAMMREDADDAAVCLIDLAEVRPGHWIEDAILLERLLWSRPERMAPTPPVEAIAAARRRHGLPVDPDHEDLAELRRLLLAATAPCFLRTEGNPRHLAACLEHGERAIARFG